MKTIFSYLMIFAVITLFALFLDATAGFFVLVIFGTSMVISTVLHIYALRLFDCDINISANIAEKGDEIKVKAKIPNAPFFLPSIFIITLDLSYHLGAENNTYTVCLTRKRKEQIFMLRANFFGKASVKVASIRAVDILGLCAAFSHFRKGGKCFAKNKHEIKIYPSVPSLSQRSELIRTLEDASAYDDNEQSREVPFAITGFPGYEHRDYVPGDSFKSINWKLSAKRDKLLTRKPEAYAGGDQVLVLDRKRSNHHPNVKDDLTARVQEQTALESMLAIAECLTKGEILCRVYIFIESGWEMFSLQSVGDIEKMRYILTDYIYSDEFENSERIADIGGEKASGFVIFTACPDTALYNHTEVLRSKGINPEIAAPVVGYANNWLISEVDGEIIFTRSGGV